LLSLDIKTKILNDSIKNRSRHQPRLGNSPLWYEGHSWLSRNLKAKVLDGKIKNRSRVISLTTEAFHSGTIAGFKNKAFEWQYKAQLTLRSTLLLFSNQIYAVLILSECMHERELFCGACKWKRWLTL